MRMQRVLQCWVSDGSLTMCQPEEDLVLLPIASNLLRFHRPVYLLIRIPQRPLLWLQ